LSGEFETQIKKIADGKTSKQLIEMVNLAGKEFPCLTCPSNKDCDTFKWFTKWFGN